MSENKSCAHIFERIAAQHNVTVEEIRRETKIAIQAGLQNPDPEVQAAWAKIPCVGTIPTPEELIAYLGRQIRKGKDEPLIFRQLYFSAADKT